MSACTKIKIDALVAQREKLYRTADFVQNSSSNAAHNASRADSYRRRAEDVQREIYTLEALYAEQLAQEVRKKAAPPRMVIQPVRGWPWN